MSTPGSPYGDLPPSDDAAIALDAADPREHHWFTEPGLKVQSIVPDDRKTSALGTVAGFGALFAVIANVLFGRLSDRATGRLGRRRPWIVGGTVVMALAFVVMARRAVRGALGAVDRRDAAVRRHDLRPHRAAQVPRRSPSPARTTGTTPCRSAAPASQP